MDNVVVVLCSPSDVRNVGPAIRAAANFGVETLRIAGPQRFDASALREFSAGALEHVRVTVHDDVRAALEGVERVLGTSRRPHDAAGAPQWSSVGLTARLAGGGPCAARFGPERAGLSVEELDLCDALVALPTSARFPSMNLGHAVACLLYELNRGVMSPAPAPAAGADPLDAEVGAAADRLALYAEMERLCDAAGYPPGRTAAGFVRKLKRLLGRARANPAELAMVAGVFRELARRAR